VSQFTREEGALARGKTRVGSVSKPDAEYSMKLESARDLKQEMLANLVEPLSVVASGGAVVSAAAAARIEALGIRRGAFAVGARPPDTLPRIQRSLAIGIAPRGGEFQLAVRVQRQGLMSGPLVVEMVQKAKGEADVRMIGRIDKRTRGRRRVELARRAAQRAARRRSAVAMAAVPWHQRNTRPLLIGASVGHVDVTAGTIGAFVRRGKDVGILSNNHVLANENDASAGDPILQRRRRELRHREPQVRWPDRD
jgi:hypothetical protein